MKAMPSHLLCIDLQSDAVPDREPDGAVIGAASRLLTFARRLGWTVAHTRRRTRVPLIRTRHATATGLNPLMSEPVFFHDTRSLADSQGLATLLQSWRGETVLVAAMDPVALLSCLLACPEPGPRLVLVEDICSLREMDEAAPVSAFHGDAWRRAFGATSLDKLIASASRQGVHLFPTAVSGDDQRRIPV